MFSRQGYPSEDSESSSSANKMMELNSNVESCQIAIDNSSNILNILKNLYQSGKMCDLFIQVGKKEHTAHRLILCASSDVFNAMLMKPEWSEWYESHIKLQELPHCEEVFHLFLEYFYTGKILITHTNVMPLLSLADKYMVKSLTRICVQYMCQHIAHAASHNQLFSWLQYTNSCGYYDVSNLCQNYIKWNFESVANTADYSNIDVNLLCDLLQQSDLIVHNEVVLYNCVVRWLQLQEIRLRTSLSDIELMDELECLVGAVMRCIRFPMMSPHELADLLLSPLLKQYSSIMLKYMSLAMLFQRGRMEEYDFDAKSEETQRSCTPRLYTCDSFNTSLLIENVTCLPSYNVSTFVFSTHRSTVECEADKISEWIVDLYPKGVCFQRCFLIVWQGTLEVPESVKSTVRLSLTRRECTESVKVRVGVILYGTQGGTEHIMQVFQRVHEFTANENILVIDNLIPFDELNPQAEASTVYGDKRINGSPYLTGPKKDQLKINIIITPTLNFYRR